jgi:hypothetical protein
MKILSQASRMALVVSEDDDESAFENKAELRTYIIEAYTSIVHGNLHTTVDSHGR